MEHWETLRDDGLRFVWEDALFRPGTDSFLLSSLPKLTPGLRVCDLGCGTGLLSFLLLQRQPSLDVTGIDIQLPAVELAKKAARENGLEDRLQFFRADLRQLKKAFPTGRFDLVICNPPYYQPDSGKTAADPASRMARAETEATLAEICAAAAYLLRWGGSFCMVHKPERMADVLCTLRESGMEPKRLRFVQRRTGDAPSLFLVEGRRGGKPGLRMERPLALETENGHPTAELDAIYFRDQEV